MIEELSDSLWRKGHPQFSQTGGVPRHSEYVITDRSVLLHLASIELIGDLISLDPGIFLKDKLQLLEHLICSMTFKTSLKSRF